MTAKNILTVIVLTIIFLLITIIATILHVPSKEKELTFDLLDYDHILEEITDDRNVGTVPTKDVAIEKARMLWEEDFSSHMYKFNDSPIVVAYDSQNKCWRINGTLPNNNTLGAVPCALIKENGEVLAVWMG